MSSLFSLTYMSFIPQLHYIILCCSLFGSLLLYNTYIQASLQNTVHTVRMWNVQCCTQTLALSHIKHYRQWIIHWWRQLYVGCRNVCNSVSDFRLVLAQIADGSSLPPKPFPCVECLGSLYCYYSLYFCGLDLQFQLLLFSCFVRRYWHEYNLLHTDVTKGQPFSVLKGHYGND